MMLFLDEIPDWLLVLDLIEHFYVRLDEAVVAVVLQFLFLFKLRRFSSEHQKTLKKTDRNG